MILHLGCGHMGIKGAVNHDITKHGDHVDVAHDLDQMPWPWPEETFEKIIAFDVVEHLKCEMNQWLNEAWRILEPRGLFLVRVPHYQHENAFTDPTHRRFFTPRTFDYWDLTKELHHKYGCYYFAEAARWWTIRRVEQDKHGNIEFDLQKP